LLYQTCHHPPKSNDEKRLENVSHEGKDGKGQVKKRITLYRGLGLPEAAIEVYREYKKKFDALDQKFGGKWYEASRKL